MRDDTPFEMSHVPRLGARRSISDARRFSRQPLGQKVRLMTPLDATPRIGRHAPSLDPDTVEDPYGFAAALDEAMVDAAIAELAQHFERIDELDPGAGHRRHPPSPGATWRGPVPRQAIPTLEGTPAIIIPLAG